MAEGLRCPPPPNTALRRVRYGRANAQGLPKRSLNKVAHMAKVAFLGLGVMGFPMAGHLVKKSGHQVTVYNRTPAKAKQWAEKFRANTAPTPKPPPQRPALLPSSPPTAPT